ncbi:phage holin family protein [Beijerinckia sp. L45]|uniref:phage holin family protein n=1 Tax=Beijerinckia sp. L45 TaxID=1641855 RepID=UPI00131D1BEE|nr:phage holin family protein [Beijerinckia sp. L45]
MSDTDMARPSTASLLGEALSQTSRLVAAEIQLVRIEISDKISIAIKAIVGIVVAAVFLIVAMIFLLQGVVALLVGFGLAVSVANFAVGGGIAVLAAIAIVVALRSLSASKLKPSRTIRQMQENSELVKGAR